MNEDVPSRANPHHELLSRTPSRERRRDANEMPSNLQSGTECKVLAEITVLHIRIDEALHQAETAFVGPVEPQGVQLGNHLTEVIARESELRNLPVNHEDGNIGVGIEGLVGEDDTVCVSCVLGGHVRSFSLCSPKVAMNDLVSSLFVLPLFGSRVLNLDKHVFDFLQDLWELIDPVCKPGKVEHVLDVLCKTIL